MKLPWLLLLAIAPGCKSLPKELEPKEVPAAIERAEKSLAEGDSETALQWMQAAVQARGLPTDQRNEVQAVLERAAAARIAQLSRELRDPEALADMLDLELPRQLAVSCGVEAARLMVEDGELMEAFRLIQKIDQRYPMHHERDAAAALLLQIGLTLADDDWSFLGLFRRRDDGVSVLEYLVLNAPWEPRCDEAYAKLAEVYEEDGDWMQAIDDHESLILYHPESRLRPKSQARIPHLRLSGLSSPEYDRSELVRAHKELEGWLETYAGSGTGGPELEHEVRLDLTDCLRRLTESDIRIARFYRTVDNPYGARFHAQRALDEARLSADGEREAAAAEFLRELSDETPEPSPAPKDEPAAASDAGKPAGGAP